MSNSNNAYFPFGPAPGNPYQAFLPYDLQISEADPGIILAPTEPNGVYFVMREVNGCVWQVLNADYVVADAQWEQAVDTNSLINAALPAYALEFCASGTVNRYTAVATIVPGVAVNWVLVWSLDASGNMTTSPLVGTGVGQIANDIVLTWNAGSPTVMSAREINLTDTSSNASSWLDNLIVNGVPKWQVRKDGTLVTGTVPYANISGTPAIPSFNNPTFTGTATFTGPVNMEDGAMVEGGLTVTGGETVSGGLGVTGGLTTDTSHVTGNEQVDGTINANGSITSGGIITAANFNNPNGVPTLGVATYTTAAVTIPAYRNTVTVPVASTSSVAVNSLVMISGTAGSVEKFFVCNVIGPYTVPTTSLVLQPLQGLNTSAPGVTLATGATISAYAPNGATSLSGAAIQSYVNFLSGSPSTTTITVGQSVSVGIGAFILLIFYSATGVTVNSITFTGTGAVIFQSQLNSTTTIAFVQLSSLNTSSQNIITSTTSSSNGTVYLLTSTA